MNTGDPSARRERAIRVWTELHGAAPATPNGPFDAAKLDFGCAEVWGRPGLARRDRMLLSLACLAADALVAPLAAMVRAALDTGELTLDELHEVMLHLAAYVGFPAVTSTMRGALNEAAAQRGLTVTPPVAAVPAGDRRAYGIRAYAEATGRRPAPPEDPLRAAAMDFVTAEVWSRPGLSHRDRRLLCVAVLVRAGLRRELRVHVDAALTGEFSVAQLDEIALHLAECLGFPRAAALRDTVAEALTDGPDRGRGKT